MCLLVSQSDFFQLISTIVIPLFVIGITFLIAKRQILNTGVTQFRQQWIDNLRESISIFIAKAEMISMLDLDDDDGYLEHFKELSQTHHKIELMLNPEEDDHNKIIEKLDEIRELIHDEEIGEDELEEKLDNVIVELLEVSKRTLKREWNVVKKGK